MIRPIVTSRILLAQPAREATAADAPVAQDLLDTLATHADTCVGLAANMIGSPVAVIAFRDGARARTMFNPRITRHSGSYETEESCLSLTGSRPATRWRSIAVAYQELAGGMLVERHGSFSGFTAQIIQHEIDHTRGIVI